MSGRTIIYDKSFDAGVILLGGYLLLYPVIDAVVDGLRGNPYAFPKFENDFISFRYAHTARTRELPPLVIIFSIRKDGSVTLETIEEDDSY
jgi:hypothetical protein